MSDIRIRKTEDTEALVVRACALHPGQDISVVVREALRVYVGDPPTLARREMAAEPTPEPNPLRAMREEAGLSQEDAADRCRPRMTRGQWANAEKAERATPEMVLRARRACGVPS